MLVCSFISGRSRSVSDPELGPASLEKSSGECETCMWTEHSADIVAIVAKRSPFAPIA